MRREELRRGVRWKTFHIYLLRFICWKKKKTNKKQIFAKLLLIFIVPSMCYFSNFMFWNYVHNINMFMLPICTINTIFGNIDCLNYGTFNLLLWIVDIFFNLSAHDLALLWIGLWGICWTYFFCFHKIYQEI